MGSLAQHQRKSIRLKNYDYSSFGYYFITICTHNRELLFGDIVNGKMILNNLGKIVNKFWLEIPEHYSGVELDEFIIMPNHIHGIIVINPNLCFVGAIHELPLQNNKNDEYKINRRQMLLPKIIGWFKMNSAKQINILSNLIGNSIWQRNYFEHIIRNEKSLNKIREYIYYNPVQWFSDRNNPKNFHVGY